MLTDLRSATVNNETFAVVAVRNRFHLHLARLSLPLDALIDSFVKSQEENGHLLLHDVSFHLYYVTSIWIKQLLSLALCTGRDG